MVKGKHFTHPTRTHTHIWKHMYHTHTHTARTSSIDYNLFNIYGPRNLFRSKYMFVCVMLRIELCLDRMFKHRTNDHIYIYVHFYLLTRDGQHLHIYIYIPILWPIIAGITRNLPRGVWVEMCISFIFFLSGRHHQHHNTRKMVPITNMCFFSTNVDTIFSAFIKPPFALCTMWWWWLNNCVVCYYEDFVKFDCKYCIWPNP